MSQCKQRIFNIFHNNSFCLKILTKRTSISCDSGVFLGFFLPNPIQINPHIGSLPSAKLNIKWVFYFTEIVRNDYNNLKILV